jgi:beta-galactosidase
VNIRLVLFIGFFIPISLTAQNIKKGTNLFDDGWRFHRGGALGAEKPEFDDSAWRVLDLPHDWSIEDLPGTNSPFNMDAISQVNGGFTTGGTGWYRKTFLIPEDMNSKRIVLQFDGVYMNPEIWINGVSMGSHPNGYTSFWFDITEHIEFGKLNVLAVKVRNEGENSRWYAGSGIYRHVWLKIPESVHISQWGIQISTTEISTASAKINIKTKVDNQSENSLPVKVITRILNSKNEELGKTESGQLIGKAGVSEFIQDVVVLKPALWSPETPSLYTAISEVFTNNQLVDREETKFGIRTLEFDAVNGFQLNGKKLKLKGGCIHSDNGPLGAKSFDRAEVRRVELLKASGFNAIRCAHNPPSPAFLDACDQLGMMVIDEAFDMWQDGKNSSDYHLYFEKWWQRDVESMIKRDFNHPSIILWSIGNEIPKMNTPEVIQTAKEIAEFVHQSDTTRQITAAVNVFGTEIDPFVATLDIAGYNYGSVGTNLTGSIFDTDHKRKPSLIMLQTESYPLDAFKSWMDVKDHDWLIGDFVWTAFDYIGEASIGWRGYWQEHNFYPWNLAFCGDIDICGSKRPQSYYRDALWKENQLSVFVKSPQPSFEENIDRVSWSRWHWDDVLADWNWKGFENQPLQVNIYSSCEEVELFLNGKSMGRLSTNRSTEYKAIYNVAYQPGELKAVGYSNGKEVKISILKTAGEPSQIQLKADRNEIKADGEDLCYIMVELTDKNGLKNPKAENLIKFDIEGPGEIVGVGNANPVSTESYLNHERKAWHGQCLVIIKSERKKGNIVLKASSANLKSAEIKINVSENTSGNDQL